jgi:glutaconate CoA-transferase, subunit A
VQQISDKVLPLAEAVRTHVSSGDVVFVGGFGQCIPFAIAHEIIRQGKTDLALCRSGADILFDLLIAAGCVRKVMIGYLGNPGLGLAHAFRRAAEAGSLEIEDWTNFSMVLRLHAGALGVPFLPTKTLHGGDIPERLGVRTVACPYTGSRLAAVPALNPDVAIVHAQRADRHGNLQLFGLAGDTVEGINASRKIVATVEEIVPSEVIKSAPNRTVVPGFRVASVSEVRWGAYPSYVHGRYGRDDAAYCEWDRLARKTDVLENWIDQNIRTVPDFRAYIARLDPERLRRLEAEASSHHG